jgi:uncharacterized protein (TIGR02301 family)
MIVCFLVALAMASPALAQNRSGPERQLLVDLSRVLGESHALRQLCRGAEDQFWRERMKTMVIAEQPEPAFQDAMEAAFNAGYDARQRQFAVCSSASRQAESQVSAKGQALARRLAKPG